MKVQDSEGNTIPNLSKVNGSLIYTDTDAYHKRLAQIRQRKRIDELETQNTRMGDDLISLNKKVDMLIKLLQEK